MGFTCGIIGLPNVGKSTLFNALTTAHAPAANYPFCTIDPNIGIVPVPDNRLNRIAAIYGSAVRVPTTLEFHDIAGLVRGASKGEGLGNQFLAHIRTVDALMHVVRCFEDPNVIHVAGKIDPKEDIEIVETELILRDIESVEKKRADAVKRGKSGEKKAHAEAEVYEALLTHLGGGRLAKYFAPAGGEARGLIRELQLLSDKPVMYVCNVHEQNGSSEEDAVQQVRAHAGTERAPVVTVSASLESEIASLPESERPSFLSGLGLAESGLEKVIREGYALLRLMTFFTAGEKETHAWTAEEGTTALTAAGKIHSDFARGFIRAEVVPFADLDRLGTESAVRDAGLMLVEGREYVLHDGDIVFIRFNV